MVLFAGREVMARQKRPLVGPWAFGLGTGCMLVAAGTVTALALLTQIRPDPWYHPRYALPLLGMVLGNTRDLAAKLVLDHLGAWDGRHYGALAPAAEALEE
jgi:ABC-type iron transport system FetAB permease component